MVLEGLGGIWRGVARPLEEAFKSFFFCFQLPRYLPAPVTAEDRALALINSAEAIQDRLRRVASGIREAEPIVVIELVEAQQELRRLQFDLAKLKNQNSAGL